MALPYASIDPLFRRQVSLNEWMHQTSSRHFRARITVQPTVTRMIGFYLLFIVDCTCWMTSYYSLKKIYAADWFIHNNKSHWLEADIERVQDSSSINLQERRSWSYSGRSSRKDTLPRLTLHASIIPPQPFIQSIFSLLLINAVFPSLLMVTPKNSSRLLNVVM